ncbi:MAG: CBS domain-containing protein [archaeon]|nr:CBS domain-containing protein [archaeon]
MLVKNLTRGIKVVEENFTLDKVAKIMIANKVGEILFVSDKKLKGIVTEDDLLRNFDSKKKIKDVMTTKIITINEEESIDDALSLMNENSIKRLPVTNSVESVVGIIRLIDIAKNAQELEGDFFFE